MKILHIIPTMNPETGGPCEAIRNISVELNKFNIQNEVVCLDNEDEAFIKNQSFTIHALGKAKGPWAYNKNLIAWLENNLSNYDKVILHALWLFQGFALNKAISKIKKKSKSFYPAYFLMPHGMLDPYFQKAKERKLKAIRNIIYWHLVENKVVNNATAILFTCEQEKILARKSFKNYFPKAEINVSYGIISPPNKIDSFKSAFNIKIPETQDITPYILFISRIHIKKGVDILVNAYEKILENYPLNEIPNLVIAGPGIDTEYGKSILLNVNSNPKLLKKIHFTGMLRDDSKWGAFYGCEAFILPSHQENFGIAVAEALGCGKPVLISNQVNIYKEIELENAGFIEEDTLFGTYTLLDKWLKLTLLEKEQISANAKKCFDNHFRIEATAQNLLRILNSY